MRQNGSCFIGKRGTSKMRQKSVKIASKLRQKCAGRTPFGRYRYLGGINSQFNCSEGRKWGVRSVVVEFGVFGAPRFSVQKSQSPLEIGIWDLWTENRGAPKTPNPTMTDLTPHLRPSEFFSAHYDSKASSP